MNKAIMAFKQALRMEQRGDEAAVERWLAKAVEAEAEALNNGEEPVDLSRLTV